VVDLGWLNSYNLERMPADFEPRFVRTAGDKDAGGGRSQNWRITMTTEAR
jgi:hypothetical protein